MAVLLLWCRQQWYKLTEIRRFTWLYTSIACISFIAAILFWFCFRKLDKKEDALNALPDSIYRGRKDSIVDVVGIREEQIRQDKIRKAQGLGHISPEVTVAGEKE